MAFEGNYIVTEDIPAPICWTGIQTQIRGHVVVDTASVSGGVTVNISLEVPDKVIWEGLLVAEPGEKNFRLRERIPCQDMVRDELR